MARPGIGDIESLPQLGAIIAHRHDSVERALTALNGRQTGESVAGPADEIRLQGRTRRDYRKVISLRVGAIDKVLACGTSIFDKALLDRRHDQIIGLALRDQERHADALAGHVLVEPPEQRGRRRPIDED